MSSALSYYSSKNRASARLDNTRNEISRSSAYIIDTGGSYGKTTSYTPSYDRNKRESSYTDSSRMGRTRFRDSSVDFSARPSRRSSSLELSAPVKLRTRDISTDIGSSRRDYTNGISSSNGYSTRTTRPKTTNFENEHSDEYKKIMSDSDKFLTMSKYAKKDKETSEVNGMMEEERRSKAYSKIMNQQSVTSLETDCARSTMTDIFMNTDGFSAKTVQAINKEMLYKEDKGPKNYSWRKDMESYEDNLEKVHNHKKHVRDATKATRDVGFKDTNSKIRNYDRECRRDVESVPVRPTGIVINTKPISQTTSYSSTAERNNNSSNSTNSVVTSRPESTADNTEIKRGSWRKDMEKYEDKICKKTYQSDTKIDASRNVSSSAGDSQPKSYSWQKTNNISVDKIDNGSTKTDKSAHVTPTWKTAETVKKVEIAEAIPEKKVSALKKSETVKVEETKPEKPVPSWKKQEPVKNVETKLPEPEKKTEHEKQIPKWKKPESVSKDNSRPEEQIKQAQNVKKVETVQIQKTVEPERKEEMDKTVPKWKKTEPVKKEEPKPAEPDKPVPKWKKPESIKKDEPKPVETKPAEPEKPVPKWKKQAVVKKEETKPVEPEKPVPKWKKAETAKKEEAKPAEPEKPVPKWKKPATAKKDEPKPAEPEKLVPKWKKPETAKKEETKPVEPEKPVPKWKKPVTIKKEEPNPEAPVTTVPKCKTPEAVPAEAVLKPEVVRKPEVVSNTATIKLVGEPEPNTIQVAPNTAEPAKETENAQEEKKEEEEEEDVTGMRAMRKEQASKFSDMDAEFAAGASKLSALRAKMKALRLKSKASSEADAAADASRR